LESSEILSLSGPGGTPHLKERALVVHAGFCTKKDYCEGNKAFEGSVWYKQMWKTSMPLILPFFGDRLSRWCT